MAAASNRQACILLLLLSLLTLLSSSAQAGDIAVYWGQNITDDGTLKATCDTGNYHTVFIAYLNVFGNGRIRQLNVTTSTSHYSSLTDLEGDIYHCQSLGIKVFLSIGGPTGEYSITSVSDANEVAQYLFSNFLSGNPGPFGSVKLDGIDFAIQATNTPSAHWDDLAKALLTYINQQTQFFLSAAPGCSYPDSKLRTAIEDNLFNFLFVRFYDLQCQFSTDPDATNDVFYDAWTAWTSMENNTAIVYLGLPAAGISTETGNGYIPPATLKNTVLPDIKEDPKYGGVMLWDRGYDAQTLYSNAIKGSLSKPRRHFLRMKAYY